MTQTSTGTKLVIRTPDGQMIGERSCNEFGVTNTLRKWLEDSRAWPGLTDGDVISVESDDG